MQFKDGDVVRLKSGGPLMTVENHRADRMVNVRWFDGATLICEAFRPEGLVVVTDAAEVEQ